MEEGARAARRKHVIRIPTLIVGRALEEKLRALREVEVRERVGEGEAEEARLKR